MGEHIELGRCPDCGAWLRGRFLADLTPHIALVEHPGCLMVPERHGERDPVRLAAAFAVSVAALVIVCVLLLTVWR
ncbi:hypothetical protein [Kitasatospora sp. NPDC093806]|uniref:hypothetical protein n=1 Tax=Kitasatospora sp. NPDC093806 TaxID=3155075 RepID=UPI0034410CD1